MSDTPIPMSREAERSVLGAMVEHEDLRARAAEELTSSDFATTATRTMFDALVELFNEGREVDSVVLADALKADKRLETVGGMTAVSDLVFEGSRAGFDGHIKAIQEKARLRSVVEAADDVIREAGNAKLGEADDILDRFSGRLIEMSHGSGGGEYVKASDLCRDYMDELEERRRSDDPVRGLRTGFERLDELTTGLYPGQLIILAARPSMGKTSLGLNMVGSVALDHEEPVAVFSLEMSEMEVIERLAAAEGRVPLQDLRTGRIGDRQSSNLADALGALNQAPIFIDDSTGLSVTRLRAKARRLKREHDINLIVVDYLQLMQGGKAYSGDRRLEVEEISRGLKVLARELDVPIVALSQLSRAPEKREQHRPRLSDLRDTGAIEQDADIVLFLYREEEYRSESRRGPVKGDAELIIGKQRNGPTETVHLRWKREITRFEPDSDIGRARSRLDQ